MSPGRLLNLNDKQRLVILLCTLLGIAFIATAWVNYEVSSASIRRSLIANELPLTTDNLYSEIQKDLVRPIMISSMMATDTFLRDWVISGEKDPERMTRYLREVKDRYGAFTSFFISERTRIYYQTEGILKTVKQDEPRDAWYFRVRAMNTPYELNVDPDLANKDARTIFVNYRVLDYNKRFIGVVGVGITMDAARTLIDSYQQRYGRVICFVDRNGELMLLGWSAKGTSGNIHQMPGLSGIADTLLRRGSGSFQYRVDGNERLLSVRFIPELNWYLLVDGTADEAIREVRRTLYINLGISLLVTLLALFTVSLSINRYQTRLEEMATTDKLTGLANRQAFDVLMPMAMNEMQRSGNPLCIMIIDIDHFKRINDDYGHLTGDKVLGAIAGVIRASVRATDIVCRWGGEEFLIVVRNIDTERGMQLAEKIRMAVEQAVVAERDKAISVTVSIGVACHEAGETPDHVISRADKALYASKAQGRNRTSAA